jgi:CheY-like chemotaxis protein
VEPPVTVLVVDDHADAAISLAELLALHGFEVRTAHDGPSALAAAVAEPPDAVVTDLAMPGMTGWEFLRRLRKQSPTVPFTVTLSGYGREQDKTLSAAAGAHLHLAKPVDPAVLVAVLRRARRNGPPPTPGTGGVAG